MKIYQLKTTFGFSNEDLARLREQCLTIVCPKCRALVGEGCWGTRSELIHIPRFGYKFGHNSKVVMGVLRVKE